jgi:hypothetical protein
MVAPVGDHLTFDDVLIDGITAYSTNLWYGIHVGFNLWNSYPTNPPLSTNIIVRNCTVHHVFGDGITAAQARNVLIEKNTVYETGLAPAGVSYTPNGIWTWQTDTTTIQYNEGYSTHSYDFDGGVFDIDWGSTNTTIQYNYAHNADGYCVAVMGAHHITTSNSIVRFNICSNNGRKPEMGPRQGDIYIVTFDGGNIDGLQIYNNTSYWNPALNGPWLKGTSLWFTGNQPRFIENNIVYSSATNMLDLDSGIAMDRDLYWVATGGTPTWRYGSVSANNMNDFRVRSGQDWNGMFADPLMNDTAYSAAGRPTVSFTPSLRSPALGAGIAWDMGGKDFFGNPLPNSGQIAIGAGSVAR